MQVPIGPQWILATGGAVWALGFLGPAPPKLLLDWSIFLFVVVQWFVASGAAVLALGLLGLAPSKLLLHWSMFLYVA